MLSFYEKLLTYKLVISFYLIIRLLSEPSFILPAADKKSICAQTSSSQAFSVICTFLFFLICRSLEEDDDVWTRTRQEAANLSASINEILGSYDPKLRPNAGGESVLYVPFHMQ